MLLPVGMGFVRGGSLGARVYLYKGECLQYNDVLINSLVSTIPKATPVTRSSTARLHACAALLVSPASERLPAEENTAADNE